MANHTEKTCSKCNETKTTVEFSKHRATRDGLDTQCKACKREYHRAWVDRNKEHVTAYRQRYYQENRGAELARAQMHKGIKNLLTRRRFPLCPPGWQFCTDCHYMLPLDMYHLDGSAPDGRAYRCKDCAITAARKHYRENRKHHAELSKERYEANKEQLLAQQTEYAQRYPQKYSLIKRAYRARERAADGEPFNKDDILRIYKQQRGRCHYCHVPLRKLFELDHVVPISKGGGNEDGNVVCTCPWCNENKRDLDADEFMRLHFRAT